MLLFIKYSVPLFLCSGEWYIILLDSLAIVLSKFYTEIQDVEPTPTAVRQRHGASLRGTSPSLLRISITYISLAVVVFITYISFI